MKLRISFFLPFLFFASTLNRLFTFPIDKFFILGTCLVLLYQQKTISIKSLQLLLIVFAVVLITFFINSLSFSFLLLFPLIGLLFVVLLVRGTDNKKYLYYGLWWHILLGLLLVIYSYIQPYTFLDTYVHYMYDKGMPFLHASMGFTPTVQTFGTMSLSWLLLYVHKRDFIFTTRVDRFMLFIVILGIIVTFNRNTFVMLIFTTFFHFKKFFYLFFLTAVTGVIYYYSVIESLVLNVKTLNSRISGLEGFQNSYVESNSLMVYLFGRGDNNIWNTQYTQNPLIENGIASMLHSFGFVGFVVYGIIGVVLVSLLLANKKWFLSFFLFYILFIQQIFTTELYNGTFYIIVASILLTSGLFNKKNKTTLEI